MKSFQGNVFISDSANGRVLEVTPAGAQTVVAGGLNVPSGVADDSRHELPRRGRGIPTRDLATSFEFLKPSSDGVKG
jgi:hypothetical protein